MRCPASVSWMVGLGLFLDEGEFMAYVSKLTELQWRKVEKRYLAGESASKLATEFGVTEAAIRKKYGSRQKEIKTIANQLYQVEKVINDLDEDTKIRVRTLADRLMSVSTHMADAAISSAKLTNKMARIAYLEAQKINEADPMDNPELLHGVNNCIQMANNASVIAISMMDKNKALMDNQSDKPAEEWDPQGDHLRATIQRINERAAAINQQT